MAQHDYVIDNATGANVRADINSALLAISSNNSGSSAPSTTYATQFFADTTNSLLKLRNTSNNAYVNLFTLAGGVSVDAASTFNEDVTFTGATSGRNVFFDKSEDRFEFLDNAKAAFGTDADLSIFHDGTNSYISEQGTGSLVLKSNTIDITHAAQDEFIQRMFENSSVEIYFDSSRKFQTKTTGVNIYGAGSTFLELGSEAGSTDVVFIDSSHSSNTKPHMDFRLDADLTVRFDSGGRVLVGGITANNVSGSDARFQVSYAKTSQFGIHIRPSDNNTGGGQPMLFQNQAGTSIGSISADASNVAFNTSSDYRLKENVVAISDGITRLKTLKPSRFNFKINPSKTVDGFLAHEVTAVPEAITGTKDEVDSDNNPVYQGIDQSKLVPLLVAAVQEAIVKIETLETKVASLEGS